MTARFAFTSLHLAADGGLLAVAPRSAAFAARRMLDLVLFPMDWGREMPPRR